MSDWKIKYDSLKEGNGAWYWHWGYNEWEPILVRKDRFGNKIHIKCVSNFMDVTEDYPNGPACLNPDEAYKIEQAYQEELAELRGELFTLRILHGGDRR